MSDGADSQSRVESSMSVNRNVTDCRRIGFCRPCPLAPRRKVELCALTLMRFAINSTGKPTELIAVSTGRRDGLSETFEN